MRFLSAFILLIVLFTVSINGQTNNRNQSVEVNQVRLSGGPSMICGTNNAANPIPVSNSSCTLACGSNYRYRVQPLGSLEIPTGHVLVTYSSNDTTCATPVASAQFKCPSSGETTKVQYFAIGEYQAGCYHVGDVATETPAAANNAANTIAVSIAILFGALISVLAL